MAKGFGQQQQSEEILIESMVSARNGAPLVSLKWGKESGALTPQEARQHAFSILEAAAAAEMDAVVFKWAQQTLSMEPSQAAFLRRMMKDDRAAGNLPSCTLNFDGDRMTPDEVRRCALDMLFMAFNTELEAFLSRFLLEQVGINEQELNAVIEELRVMRGLKRVDELANEE